MSSKVALCVIALLWGEACTSQEVFSAKREFGPVRFSQQQLVELVDRLHVFSARQVSTTVQSDDAGHTGVASHTLRLSDEQSSIEITEDISMETLSPAPPVATSVRYTRRDGTGVVRSISLNFLDSSRTLKVSGASRDQVEAVANLAGTLIGEAEIMLGGSAHRVMGWAVLVSISLMLIFGVDRTNATLVVRNATATIGVLFSLAPWIFPWKEWLPGAVVYRDDAAFFVRHGALITFLGGLVTIGALLMSIVKFACDLRKREGKVE